MSGMPSGKLGLSRFLTLQFLPPRPPISLLLDSWMSYPWPLIRRTRKEVGKHSRVLEGRKKKGLWLFVFWNKDLPNCPGWFWTHDLPPTDSRVVGLDVSAIVPSRAYFFLLYSPNIMYYSKLVANMTVTNTFCNKCINFYIPIFFFWEKMINSIKINASKLSDRSI